MAKKKDISKKEAQSLINEMLINEIPRKQILNDLSTKYYGKDVFEQLISSTPNKDKKLKYTPLNNLLLIIMFVFIVGKLVIGSLLLSEISIFAMPFAFLFPLLNLIFAAEVFNFKGYIYNLVIIFTILGIFKSIPGIFLNWMGIVELSLAVLMIVLAYIIKTNVFPHLGIFRPKNDKNGNMLLGE